MNSTLTLCFVSDGAGFYWRRQAMRQVLIHLVVSPYPAPHMSPTTFGGLAAIADAISEELYRAINDTDDTLVRFLWIYILNDF